MRRISLQELIESDLANKTLPGMEKEALVRFVSYTQRLKSLVETLGVVLHYLVPLGGTAHEGECPGCKARLYHRGERVGAHRGNCNVERAMRQLEAYTAPVLNTMPKEGGVDRG